MAHSPHSPFSLAVAVFVKTPGRSPLKTRLAKTVGTDKAHQFYQLSCKAIANTLSAAYSKSGGTILPIWAVAEDDADHQWLEFPICHQGIGELGDKLNRVYGNLLKRYDAVALIGADAPQITTDDILKVHEMLQSGQDFVVGPASDGGFYLFAGRKPLNAEIWLNTPYSHPGTLEALLPAIKKIGAVASLHQYTDVDRFEDLGDFLKESQERHSGSRSHEDLIKLVSELIGFK